MANAARRHVVFRRAARRWATTCRRHETGNLGLYELAERLLNLFGLLGRNGESEYLFRFLDLTLEYSLKFGNNLGNFLTHWEERKGRISINAPGGRAAITITTVHKAKGLAYGVVIVPFADWSLEPHRGTLLWGHLEAGQKPLELHARRGRGEPEQGHAADGAGGAVRRGARKNLPRRAQYAVRGLHPPAPPPLRHQQAARGQRKPPKPTSWRPPRPPRRPHRGRPAARLPAEPRRVAGGAGVFRPLARHTRRKETKHQQPATSKTYDLTNLAAAPWEDRLKLRRHATTLFDFDEQKAQGEWNRKLHYALRRLLTAADVGRVASQLVAEGILSARERPALVESLETLVSDPRLAPYFAPHLSVETEREILVGGVKLRDYKPDRVVLEPSLEEHHRLGGRVTLLDFRLPPPQEKHKRQLRNYATLFEQLGYAEVRGVIYYFGTGEVVEV